MQAIRSFIMSDRSESLTVAHLSWVILANHSQLLNWSEQMSEFPTLIIIQVVWWKLPNDYIAHI